VRAGRPSAAGITCGVRLKYSLSILPFSLNVVASRISTYALDGIDAKIVWPAAGLSHPGIAVVHALEEVGDHFFIVSEYVRGETLRSAIGRGAMSVDQSLDYARQIGHALCAAHEAGIIHRDLKPENVLITGAGHLKVVDFGIAHIAGEVGTQLTMAGAIFGTPAYMAPEQLAGAEADARSDLYALGVMLSEMVTGVHPLAPSAPATSDPQVAAVVGRCLAREPRARYASARALLAAMARAASEPVTSAAAFAPRWWWEFHQAAAAGVYGLMMIPLWQARSIVGPVAGRVLFVLGLAGAVIAAVLRLHLWFTSRFYGAELAWVRARITSWITAADWVFALSLVAAGVMVGDDQSPLAITLLSVGIGIVVAFLVIEPVTTRAAFRNEDRAG